MCAYFSGTFYPDIPSTLLLTDHLLPVTLWNDLFPSSVEGMTGESEALVGIVLSPPGSEWLT